MGDGVKAAMEAASRALTGHDKRIIVSVDQYHLQLTNAFLEGIAYERARSLPAADHEASRRGGPGGG